MTMNVPAFQAKWRGATLKERSAAQEHFIDLSRLLALNQLRAESPR